MPSTRDPENTFVEWLLEEIDKRGWNKEELSRRMGVYPATISGIVNRQKALGPDVAKRIAAALDVSQIEVFERAGLIDEELADEKEAAREYLRLLSEIEDSDERERAVGLVETILRRIASDQAARQGNAPGAPRKTGAARGKA